MIETEKFSILKVTEQGRNTTEDVVVKEFRLAIILNNQELATLLCSPTNLKYLAVGFLVYEGLIKSKDDIEKIVVDEGKGLVLVETKQAKKLDDKLVSKQLIASSGGRGLSSPNLAEAQQPAKIDTQIEITPSKVFALTKEFQHRSPVYKATGGVHSAALCDTKSIQLFSEDIGRHNAVDKIFGECILNDIPTNDKIIITSGRVSSEQLLKVARRKIPIMISLTVPTDLGIKLADDFGITLIGSVRGEKMNVYTGGWRVVE